VPRRRDRVVFLGGAVGSGALDAAFVFDLGTLPIGACRTIELNGMVPRLFSFE
jgi:hypothetical protein